jgi:lysozyme
MSGAGDPMTADQAAAVTAALCRRFEGFRARAYLCPAGAPTIGYGATAYLDGRPVRLADPPLSREAAERLLLGHMQVYLPGTQALCPGLQGRALAAITDFAFNLGLTRLKASTLRRRLLAGDLDWRGLRRNVRVTPAQSTLRNTTEHSEKPRESTL